MPLGLNAVGKQSILFEFDSIVDLQLAVIKALRKDYPSGGNNPSINYDFLHRPFDQIMRDRVYLYNKNVVQECFLGRGRDSYKTIYESYINPNGEYDRIIGDAPIIIPIFKLITTYGRAAGGIIKAHIRCDNEQQAETLKKFVQDKNIHIFVAPRSEIDINDYVRIVVADVHYLDEFKDLSETPKFIAVLNYGCNLEVIENDTIILRDYIIKYGLLSSIQIIDSFQLGGSEE